MKRIFTFSLLAVIATIILAGCSKRSHYDEWNDYENEESGRVTYISEVNSPYSVIRMQSDGKYAVVYSNDKNADRWPLVDDIIYGDYTIGGNRQMYNRTAGYTIRLDVDDFFNNENDAINSVIRKEDQEGYAKAFKNNPIKIQRQSGSKTPAIK